MPAVTNGRPARTWGGRWHRRPRRCLAGAVIGRPGSPADRQCGLAGRLGMLAVRDADLLPGLA